MEGAGCIGRWRWFLASSCEWLTKLRLDQDIIVSFECVVKQHKEAWKPIRAGVFFYLESEGETARWQLHLSDGFLTTGDIWWFQSTLANCKTRVSWLHVFSGDEKDLLRCPVAHEAPAGVGFHLRWMGISANQCGPLIAKLGIIWRVFFESLNPKSSNIH